MCMEDHRMGEVTVYQFFPINVGAAAVLVLPRNPLRTAILLPCPSAGTFHFSTSSGVVAGTGIRIPTASPTIQLLFRDWGKAVTDEWYCIADAAGRLATILTAEFNEENMRRK